MPEHPLPRILSKFLEFIGCKKKNPKKKKKK